MFMCMLMCMCVRAHACVHVRGCLQCWPTRSHRGVRERGNRLPGDTCPLRAALARAETVRWCQQCKGGPAGHPTQPCLLSPPLLPCQPAETVPTLRVCVTGTAIRPRGLWEQCTISVLRGADTRACWCNPSSAFSLLWFPSKGGGPFVILASGRHFGSFKSAHRE